MRSHFSWRRLRLLIATAGLLSAFAFLLATHSQHEAVGHRLSSDYRIEFTQPLRVRPGTPTEIELSVWDNADGTPVVDALATESVLLLVLASQDLSYSQDIQASYQGGGVFSARTILPSTGAYNLYASFTPPTGGPAVAWEAVATSDNIAAMPTRFTVTPYFKVAKRMFEGRYLVVVQWRGDSTPSNSMGLEFLYQVGTLPGPDGSPNKGLSISPVGPMLIISEDGRSMLTASPMNLRKASQDSEDGQIAYSLNTFPSAGRYKLFARLQHDDQMFLTDFMVDLP